MADIHPPPSPNSWECGIRRLGEIWNAIAITVFRVPYEFVAEGWNTLIILIMDSFVELVDVLSGLVKAGKIVNKWVGLGKVAGLILGADGSAHIAEWFGAIWSVIGDIFNGIMAFFVCIFAWLSRSFTALFTVRDIFYLSCTFCALDPHVNECPIRSPPDGAPADLCNDCHDLTPFFFGCWGGLLDTIFGDFLPEITGGGTSFERIFRAAGCILRSLFWSPFFILTTFFTENTQSNDIPCIDLDDSLNIFDKDSLITLWWMAGTRDVFFPIPDGFPDPTYDCGGGVPGGDSDRCCGKPAGCLFPDEGGTDLPIGVIPCLDEFIAAITDDSFDDFLEMILAFFMKIVQDIIKTFTRIIDAFSQPAFDDCLKNFPAQGNPGTTPGVCFYAGGSGFEELVPEGGINDCFGIVNDFLQDDWENNAPLLGPLITSGILDFLFGDFWRFTVDFVVCPFAAIPLCFSSNSCVADLDGFISCMTCLSDDAPIWSPFADAIIAVVKVLAEVIGVIDDIINGLNEAASCLLCCFGDGFGEIAECFKFPGGDGCECGDPDELSHAAFDRLRRGGKDELPAPPAASAADIERWHTFITDVLEVPQWSMCGAALWNSVPSSPPTNDWGHYAVWGSCMAMYTVRLRAAQLCNNGTESTHVNPGELTAWSTASTMGSCAFSAAKNRSATAPPRQFRHFMNSTVEDLPVIARNIVVGVKNFSFVPQVFTPVWNQIKTTSLYARTTEFSATYTKLAKEESSTQDDLDILYTTFANDVLRFKRTGLWRNQTVLPAGADELTSYRGHGRRARRYTEFSTAELGSLYDRIIGKATALGVFTPNDYDMIIKVNETVEEDARELWDILNDHLGIQYWPTVQFMAGMGRAVKLKDPRLISGMLMGRTKFVLGRSEFVPAQTFDKERAVVERFSTVNRLSASARDAREVPRRFAPFPIPAELSTDDVPVIAWAEDASRYIRIKHLEYEKRRELKAKRLGRPVGVGANDVTFWFLDNLLSAGSGARDLGSGILGFFAAPFRWMLPSIPAMPYTNSTITGTVMSAREMWRKRIFIREPTDDPTHYWTAIEEFFEAWFTCELTENIDGSSAYSPFCLFLLPETMFGFWVDIGSEESNWPMQVQWPEELVTEQCVSVYNGVSTLLDPSFQFSDNCALDEARAPVAFTCNQTAGSCLDSTTITATVDLNFEGTAIQYEFGAQGSCQIDSFVFDRPACAHIVNVTGTPSGCVLSFGDVNASTLGCIDGLLGGGGATPFRVDVTGTSCGIVVEFDHRMVFAGSPALLSGGGEVLCTDCFAFQAIGCSAQNAPTRDPFSDQRPFCDACDYCAREYQSCADAGFGSVVDSIGFILLAAPRIFIEVIDGGIEFDVFESAWGATIGAAVLITGIIPLLLSCCLLWPGMVLAIEVAYLIPWTVFIMFGFVPWGLFLLILLVLLVPRLRGASIVFRFFVAFIALFVLAWLLNLAFEYADDIKDVSLIGGVVDVLQWIDDVVFFWWIKPGPLIEELRKFDIPADEPIPDLATFCFGWTISNAAIAGALLMLSPLILRFAWRVMFALLIAFMALLALLFAGRRKARQILTHDRSVGNEDDIDVNESRLKRLDRQSEEMISKLSKNVIRTGMRFMGRRIGNDDDDYESEEDEHDVDRTRPEERVFALEEHTETTSDSSDVGTDDEDEDDASAADPRVHTLRRRPPTVRRKRRQDGVSS